MITLGHVARLAGNGMWQCYAKRESGAAALFFATTREEAVLEAVRWVGGGDPMRALDFSLGGLSELLEAAHG